MPLTTLYPLGFSYFSTSLTMKMKSSIQGYSYSLQPTATDRQTGEAQATIPDRRMAVDCR